MVALVVKNQSANAGDIRDAGSISEWGRSPGAGHCNPLQFSCLENSMDREAWQAAVRRVVKSWTRRKRLSPATIVESVPSKPGCTTDLFIIYKQFFYSTPLYLVLGIVG